MAWTGQNMQKHCVIFKKMIVNRYAYHVLSIVNCMPQHYIHTTHCYKTFHYKRYTKYKYILNTYYGALQNNPKARNYSHSKVSQHGKRNSL